MASRGLAGLSTDEAAARQRRDGRNELPQPARPSPVRQLVGELVHFFALMLWAAAALAWLADMPQLTVAIAAVVVINALFSFVQEQRSDHAAERLRAMLPRRATVRRDGEPLEIDAGDVVAGDVLLLSPGDRICADAVVRLNRGLRVDTSMLTGESEAQGVDGGERVHAGTFVVDGEAECQVEAIGRSTRLAQISTLASETRRPERPLTTELNRVVRSISIIATSVGVAFLGVSLLAGMSTADALVFAIGVTVALVPEGLLPTVTLALAIGAQRMAKHHALVRHLDAVETLGSTTFICTDKTGTLTENRMVVTALWTPGGARMSITGLGYSPDAQCDLVDGDRCDVLDLVIAGTRCGTGRAVLRGDTWEAFGDPMEAALDACARRLSIDIAADRATRPELERYPFDSGRKRMSVVLGDEVVVKGALESVLPLCDDEPLAQRARDEAERLAELGLRVIAVARRSASGAPTSGVEDAERDMELVGVVGLLDPPRPAAKDALGRCRRAGIKVAMITGDHPRTARSIAAQVGLSVAGSPVFISDDLPDDVDLLGAMLDRDGVIIARATPEDKLRIAQALRRRGHIVAMTGDGVNDGPALRAASIGIAMGRSGTDVAREAADVVLLDDDFATIVEAVAQGRATFLNVRRFLTYHLTDNVAELSPYLLWAFSGGRIPLALTVMQILALDIGTDTTSATALGAERPSTHVLDGPPVAGRLLNRGVAVRAFGLLGPTEALVSMAAFFATFVAAGWRPGDSFPGGATLYAASGAAFLAVVLGQKANAWACRSVTVTPWRLGWFSNRLLLWTASVELVFASACLLVAPVADALEQRLPTAAGWVVAALAVPAVLLVDALYKRRRRVRRAPVAQAG